MAGECEHGAECHDGTESSAASAPEASRAWLLIEHAGPWPHEPTETVMPRSFGTMVTDAAELGIRVQMIRRPGRRAAGAASSVFAGCTAGSEPWLRRADLGSGDDLAGLDLEKLADGNAPGFGTVVSEPVFLVCTHGRRNVCCARFGGPLAQALAAALASGAPLVNLSLAGPADPLLAALVEAGEKRGVVFVGAAADADSPFPTAIPGVITAAGSEPRSSTTATGSATVTSSRLSRVRRI